MAFAILFTMSFAASAEIVDAVPIKAVIERHWSQGYVEYLAGKTDIDFVFRDKDLDAHITVEDFANLIGLAIDKDYDRTPDSVAREAIVYECARIWAEKTGQDLDQVIITMIEPYTDSDQMDSRYSHGVYVAYHLEIARGRGNGIFDPKTTTTYGELATLVSRTNMAIEKTTGSAPQPIAAGRFETRGNYEIKEDRVVFDFELFSHYTQPKELMFSSGQQFEITITDGEGKEVYRYSDGKFFTLALVTRTINPGGSLKWQDEWDMTNKDGQKAGPGRYKAVITILVIPDAENGDLTDQSQFTTEIEFSLQ
ncbi:MAG: hypothetical protein GX027_09120 [Clostridiaceae bacterium]|nr:hypothetical protein [Clostridiaceae bacterium]